MSTAVKCRPARQELKPGEVLCDYCTARCCRYFALPIETPKTIEDFDFIRWYLLHQQASVFTDDNVWYLMIHTTCKHLKPDNRCGIYATRPDICREYSADSCEYDGWVYERYLETPEQVDEYAEAIFSDPDAPDFRSMKPSLLPILG